MPPNHPHDRSYAQALVDRLRTLTHLQQRFVLGQGLTILKEELPNLPPPEQQQLAAGVAIALDAAGCRHEALLLRLALDVPRTSPAGKPYSVAVRR